jgi:hypothetical protein
MSYRSLGGRIRGRCDAKGNNCISSNFEYLHWDIESIAVDSRFVSVAATPYSHLRVVAHNWC